MLLRSALEALQWLAIGAFRVEMRFTMKSFSSGKALGYDDTVSFSFRFPLTFALALKEVISFSAISMFALLRSFAP